MTGAITYLYAEALSLQYQVLISVIVLFFSAISFIIMLFNDSDTNLKRSPASNDHSMA